MADGLPEVRRAPRGQAVRWAPKGPRPEVACPWCGSADTERMSMFGTHAMVAQYFCRSCRTAFEAVRWRRRQG